MSKHPFPFEQEKDRLLDLINFKAFDQKAREQTTKSLRTLKSEHWFFVKGDALKDRGPTIVKLIKEYAHLFVDGARPSKEAVYGLIGNDALRLEDISKLDRFFRSLTELGDADVLKLITVDGAPFALSADSVHASVFYIDPATVQRLRKERNESELAANRRVFGTDLKFNRIFQNLEAGEKVGRKNDEKVQCGYVVTFETADKLAKGFDCDWSELAAVGHAANDEELPLRVLRPTQGNIVDGF